MARKRDRAAFMISVVSEQYQIHPQTLRLYEREGLLKPSRTEGNTRLYTEKDLERLEVILSLTRDLGVNLAGVEIILNMREKMEAMQLQMQEFIACLSQQMAQAQTPPPAPDASGRALVPLARRAAPAPSRDRKKA
jgi:MerR family transcriptional regulator/heat shock protein HspR